MRWALLGAILALAAGALVGAFALPPLRPPSSATVEGPRAVSVTDRAFDDAHAVAAVPELSDEASVVLSGHGGMVTASACEPGATVKTGDHLLSVDGDVRIAVVTDVPLWRDLETGSEGTDVAALQRALIAQGHRLSESGEYDWETAAAVESLQEAASVDDTGSIALDRVQWVPAGIGAVASCEAGIGTAIAQGAPLLTAGGALVALTLPEQATDLPDRRYAAVAADLVVPIGDDRRLTEAALMAAVGSSTAFADWVEDPARGVAVNVRLAEPIAAIGIPPSAVVVNDATSGCVVAAGDDGGDGSGDGQHGAIVPITILSSELGTVFAVAETPVERVMVPAAEVISSCG